MNQLCFYVGEKQHHAGMMLYEWLLEEARGLGGQGRVYSGRCDYRTDVAARSYAESKDLLCPDSGRIRIYVILSRETGTSA